jgi:hypothetical protein
MVLRVAGRLPLILELRPDVSTPSNCSTMRLESNISYVL